MPYVDRDAMGNSCKSRPILFLGMADQNDCVALPISTITHREHVSAKHDIPISLTDYPKLRLRKDCYVRTHKQTFVHQNSLKCHIANVQELYSDLFQANLDSHKSFNDNLQASLLGAI